MANSYRFAAPGTVRGRVADFIEERGQAGVQDVAEALGIEWKQAHRAVKALTEVHFLRATGQAFSPSGKAVRLYSLSGAARIARRERMEDVMDDDEDRPLRHCITPRGIIPGRFPSVFHYASGVQA